MNGAERRATVRLQRYWESLRRLDGIPWFSDFKPGRNPVAWNRCILVTLASAGTPIVEHLGASFREQLVSEPFVIPAAGGLRVILVAGLKDAAAGRPQEAGAAALDDWAADVPAAARVLADACWPGPLTLVLPGGSGRLPDLLRGPDGGIAVRWTSHQAIAQLVAALGVPLTSTSANLPGQPPGPGAAAIARDVFTFVHADAMRGRLAPFGTLSAVS